MTGGPVRAGGRRKGALQIARVGRVRVYVDPILPVVLVLLAVSGVAGEDPWRTGASLLALVLFVTVHEAGHAWMARRRGLVVEGIFLHLFPATYLEEGPPDDAWRVALAGPLFNLALAVGFGLLHVAVGGDVGAWLDRPLGLAAVVNLLMAVLNLVPVLPADGGRVLRAVLEMKRGPELAHRAVGWSGLVLGLLAGASAYVLVPRPFGLWLALLGVYVAYVGARGIALASSANPVSGR